MRQFALGYLIVSPMRQFALGYLIVSSMRQFTLGIDCFRRFAGQS